MYLHPMQNVRDLHIGKEILPLFDHTGNDFSKDILIEILSDPAGSVAAIVERQNILRGFLGNGSLHQPFSYARSECNEVYMFIKEIGTARSDPRGLLDQLLNGKKTSREKGRLSQLYIFLHKLNNFYFTRLNVDLFPASFREKIDGIQRLLAHLDVGKYETIARQRSFTVLELNRLVGLIGEKIGNGEMDSFWKDLFTFEAWLSIAKGIRKHQFSFPIFVDEGLSIKDFYHPLVRNPVKNSLVTRECVTLITGPNMSGKSTLLKSIGLCVYLAHLGLAVPAAVCELPFFEVISVAINLQDDITSGYSHFMTEIKNLKSVVIEARKPRRCFAIFDELFRGTNIEDALTISAATINGLTHFRGSHFFISTHLHQLKNTLPVGSSSSDLPPLPDLPPSSRSPASISTRYIECTLVSGKPVFTYRLRDGWSDLRIGQILFEQEGLTELLAAPHPQN